MKLTESNLTAVFSMHENQGLTVKDILSFMSLPKSKKTRLRKVLRGMAKQGLISKTNNRYFHANPNQASQQGRKRGDHSPSNRASKSRNSQNFSRVQKGDFLEAQLVAGNIPQALILFNGELVEVGYSYPISPLPNDIVGLEKTPDSNGRYRIAQILDRRHVKLSGFTAGHLKRTYFQPFGYPYLRFKLNNDKRSMVSQGTIGDIKLFPESKRSSSDGLFIPKKQAEINSLQLKDWLKHDLGLNKPFPTPLNDELEKLPSRVTLSKKDSRKDLRNLNFITIDGNNAKDFDDAIYAEKSGRGYALYVSIADVPHFVSYRSNLDIEAEKRGNSYYLGDEVRPMLPEKLSNHLCSLKPKVNRFTMTCEMFIDNDGTPLSFKVYPSIIRSAARVTYEEYDKGLDEEKWRASLTSSGIEKQLVLYAKIADLLRDKRTLRGMINFTFPEMNFKFGKQGQIIDVEKTYQTRAMGVIEQFMLEANEGIAKFCEENHIPIIWRTHPPPQAVKIKEMQTIFKQAGIKAQSLTSQTSLNELLAKVRASEYDQEIEFYILRCMSTASYGVKQAVHFGLATDAYCHFTSPIRRYADLFNMRAIQSFLDAKKPDHPWSSQAKAISETEKNASRAEQKTRKILLMEYSQQFMGKIQTANVRVVMNYGIFIELENYAEGFISSRKLMDLGFIHVPDKKCFRLGKRTIKLGEHMKAVITNLNTETFRVICDPAF